MDFSGIDWAEKALQAWEVIAPVAVIILGGGFTLLAQLTSAKVKNAAFQALLVRLESLAYVVVRDVQQSVVEAIRERNADGKLTPAEQAEIRQIALAKLLSFVNVTEIKKAFGFDKPTLVDGLLSSMLEAALLKLKAELKA